MRDSLYMRPEKKAKSNIRGRKIPTCNWSPSRFTDLSRFEKNNIKTKPNKVSKKSSKITIA